MSIPLPAKSAEYENLRKDKEIKWKTFIDNKCEQTFLSYKRAGNTCNNYLKSLRIKSSQENFSILDTPSKRWKFINSLRNSFNVEASIGTLKNALGDLVTEPKKIVNLLNYRFTTLGDYKGESNELYYANIASENHSIFNFRFVTQREVRDTILKLSVNKPLGPTKISMWAIKDGMNAILPHLTFAINSSVSENTFPSTLKTAHVIPIFKKDDPEDPANYRPISLTPCLSKVIERLLADQINEYLFEYKILTNKQFGFRAGYSTTDALLYTSEIIRRKLDENIPTAAAFLDLSKAFDSLSHEILYMKMRSIGFKESAVALLASFLTNRSQRVKLNGVFSDEYKTTQGVPQGTVLGPLLFIIYVNDMCKAVSDNYNLIQYADDTTLLCSKQTTEMSIRELETNFHSIIQYFRANKLMINISKTQFSIFCKPRASDSIKDHELNIEGKSLKQSKIVKFLGILLDRHLSFDEQINKMLKSMAAGIQAIKSLQGALPEPTLIALL